MIDWVHMGLAFGGESLFFTWSLIGYIYITFLSLSLLSIGARLYNMTLNML